MRRKNGVTMLVLQIFYISVVNQASKLVIDWGGLCEKYLSSFFYAKLKLKLFLLDMSKIK